MPRADSRGPAISTPVAISVLIAYTLTYVVPFYLSATTRPSASLSRDAPSVIRARIRSVTVSCLVCTITTFLILINASDNLNVNHNVYPTTRSGDALHHLGYIPVGLTETARCLLLTATLFLGPLFEASVVEGRWRGWIRLHGLDVLCGWTGWRNIVAGPITEEILFRSASVPLLLLSPASITTIIFLTPIIFGLAHVHHFYEYRLTNSHVPAVQATLRSLLQFTYTTLFGGYATFLFLRTGSLLSVILVHAFCNWMGFPRFWGKVSAGETVLGPDFGEGRNGEDQIPLRTDAQMDLGWTVLYYFLLVVGAVSWWRSLWAWTESESALVIF